MLFWSIQLFLIVLIFILGLRPAQSAAHHACQQVLYWFLVMVLFLSILLRGSFGIDWNGYQRLYDEILPLYELVLGKGWLGMHIEPGFQIYLGFLKLFGLHANFIPALLFLFFSTWLFISCRATPKYQLQLLALYALLVYPHFYGQMRMAAVYSTGIIIATSVITKGDAGHQLGKILFAASFQYIGLAYVLLSSIGKYANRHLRVNLRVGFKFSIYAAILLLLGISSVDSFLDLLEKAFLLMGENPISQKFLSYLGRAQVAEPSYFGITLVGAIALALFLVSGFIQPDSSSKTMLFCSALLVIAIFFFLMLAASFHTLSHRLVAMFLIPAISLVTVMLFRKKRFFLIGIFVLFYSASRFYNSTEALGPYISIF